MADAAQIWRRSADHSLGSYANIHVQVWRGAQTLHQYNLEAPPRLSDLCAHHPAGIIGLIVIEPGAAPPDAVGRRNASTVWHRFEAAHLGMGLLVAGNRLRGTLVRAALQTIMALGGIRRPFRSFAAAADAAAWIDGLDPARPLDRAAFLAFVDGLRHETK